MCVRALEDPLQCNEQHVFTRPAAIGGSQKGTQRKTVSAGIAYGSERAEETFSMGEGIVTTTAGKRYGKRIVSYRSTRAPNLCIRLFEKSMSHGGVQITNFICCATRRTSRNEVEKPSRNDPRRSTATTVHSRLVPYCSVARCMHFIGGIVARFYAHFQWV